MTENKTTKIEISTSLGDIVISLYDETPKHRDNFIKLVNEGYYNGTLFHRVIKDFMIQAGDGDSKNAKPGQMLGTGGPGYDIEAEIIFPQYFHKRGAIAAARQGDNVNPKRKSSGSQFYIVTGKVMSKQQLDQMAQQMEYRKKQDTFQKLAEPHRKDLIKLQMAKDTAAIEKLRQQIIDETEAQLANEPLGFTQEQIEAYTTIGGTPHLDGQYTVFGEIISGMDVVEKIEKASTNSADRPNTDIIIKSMNIIKN